MFWITNTAGKSLEEVSQGALSAIKLGSAGSKVGKRIGAATSYGVGQLEFMRISIGVSAAKAKTSEAVSNVFQSQIGKRWHRNLLNRCKRDDVSAATSLNEVIGTGAKSVMGSTGISAGPVATSISLGSILLAARNSFSAVNAGALAAQAGSTDAANVFSNSNIGGDSSVVTRSKGTGGENDEVDEDEPEDEKDEQEDDEDEKDGTGGGC
ncbi:hypothetical protein GE061_014818 [Apolygus lucorum]|uniref:Uncharacterized protein n=1 Tax=Apolygus lucorum TaxID=248454 RepID=A0A8S9XNC0_APOLU|nr:hypothetical protein GE061_014818 [Apolygus lucorum]